MWRVIEIDGKTYLVGNRARLQCSPEVAEKIASLANKHNWGRFQARLAIWLLTDGQIPANAGKVISKNKAKKYFSSYQRSLDNLAKDLGAVYVPGPRGGKDAAKYVLPKNLNS